MFALTEFHATLAADNDDGDDGGNEIQLNEEDSSSQAMTVKVIQKYQKLKLQQKKCLKNGNFEAASRNLFDKERERGELLICLFFMLEFCQFHFLKTGNNLEQK